MRLEDKMGLSLLRATGSQLGTPAPVCLSVPAVWKCHTEGGSWEASRMAREQVGMWALGPAEMSCPHPVSPKPVTSVTSCHTVGCKGSYHVDVGNRIQQC